MKTKTDLILSRWERMKGQKQPWLEYWQQLGDIFLPNRADFVTAHTPGRPRTEATYDDSPRLAARSLSTTIDALLKPKSQRWFWLTVDDEDLAEAEDVKYWLQDATDRMWAAIYRKQARFTQRSGETDEGLVVFGTSALWIGVNARQNSLAFRSFPLRQFCIAENSDAEIDQFAVSEMLTPMQAIDRFGEDSVHPEVLAAAKRSDGSGLETTASEYVQMILPRDDYAVWRLDAKGKPYCSVTLDVVRGHKVAEGGFDEFPVAVPRWDTSLGEVYGRSPAMFALPDAKTLQAMGKTLLIAGQMAVDPPKWVTSDAALSPLRTYPGGLTVIDALSVREFGGAPIGTLDMGKNLPLGLEMQNAYRKQVEAAFFKDVFNLPIESRAMTATEILERKEEYQRTIGPVFGRLEADYIGHICERVFGIMMRAESFPPLPEALRKAKTTFRFEYMSPIQRARKQTEASGLARGFEVLNPLINLQPDILDHIDGEEIVRDMPEWANIPQKWLKPKKKVEEMRAARQEVVMGQQAIAEVQQGAGILKDVAAATSRR